ncbi:hypothetical protein L3Q82_004610 [Scortum barcoo]|uniref:Uncharacterized protein n=1 Tax=Scortum barcoo TaxID=214431 RepID=A0ACB8VHD6_9TELE|nr:hypothetical protein L3Q82_004610 [Scortum barcoo]
MNNGVAVFSNVVIIGDRLAFPRTKDCMRGGASLIHRLPDDSVHRVADFSDAWMPGPGYRDRMSPGKSVVLRSANVNDNGLYELTCGAGDETLIQVEVVPASRVSVTEGEDITVSFHHISVGGALAYARCDRNGTLFFEIEISSGNITYGPGLESRVSVSSGWKTDGDFSPTLRRAQMQDRGDYLFYALDKAKMRTRESLVTVRVEVKKNQSDLTTDPPTPVNATQRPAEGRMETWAIVGVTVAVTVPIVLALGIMLGRLWKSRKSSVPPCSRCGAFFFVP